MYYTVLNCTKVEAAVYGELTWLWLERVTLPLVIFFRSEEE